MKSALAETVLRLLACLAFLGAVAIGFSALLADEPRMLIPAAVLLIGAMFFGAWSRKV